MSARGTGLLVAVIVLATVAFGIGAALEKATPSKSAPAIHQEAAGATEPGATGETAAGGEEVLGINPEATPLIVSAILGSVALAVAVWIYRRRPAVLWLAAGVMAAFAVLDLIEFVHQVSEKHPLLVALAGVVAILHGTAAVLAVRLTGVVITRRATA